MGWSLRRTIRIGPLKINLSRTGVGFSIGARGLRIGRDSTGRNYSHLSIPGTGIYRRDYGTKGAPLTWALVLRKGWPVALAVLAALVIYEIFRK
jgi:hypothetical protein